MTAYYNEIDANAAAWLRELIARGLIAPGDVDSRSIEDVSPDDLRGYTQCHFFAGIGVWSYALRRAGWPDDRPVWTGSCPCQPFSAAGKGAGFADERHLWPAWFWLIEQCRPAIVFGEQVASKDAEPWIDLVQDDMEALGYRVGAIPFPSAGIGAPHIRDRLYWAAERGVGHADAYDTRSQGERQQRGGEQRQQPQDGSAGTLAHADGGQFGRITELRWTERDGQNAGRPQGSGELGARRDNGPAGPTNGLWRDADWLLCRDGKWRPVEPGTFPLAHGAAARVGRLRGYGNAINASAAQAWIASYLEARADLADDRRLRLGVFA